MTNLEKNASGLLRIAVRRMARSYPFHAHLLLPERFVCVPEVDTIGVTICDARLQFWYAPDFICRCSLDELAASLHHEVNHILFEHLLANPDEFPDQRARIIAEEVTANEWIVEPLPGSPITLDQFPNLPPLEDTETRYARLVGDSMSKGRRTTQLGQETVRSGPDLVQAGRKPARFGEKTGAYPLDNHDIWKSIRVNPLVGRLVISAAVHQAKAQLKPTDWQNVPTTLRDQIDHVIHNVQSSEVINPQGNGAVDWGRVLRQFIAKMLARRPALHRVPRRFPDMIGVVPGKSQSAVRHRVMAVIDTSASMTSCMLERIGEVAATQTFAHRSSQQ